MLYLKLINENKQVWDDYTNHIFAKQVSSGELKIEKFKYYLGQDYIYLQAYRNCYQHMANNAQTVDERSYFKRNTIGAIEADMVQMYNVDITRVTPSTITNDYISYLYKILVEGSSLEKLVAIAPCTIGYGELATTIQQSEINGKYEQWIATYASTEYQNEVDEYISLLNMYEPSEEQFEQLSNIFHTVCKHEIAFFNQAIEQSKPIVLTIAGSDSGGGAGIQADIKAISANGCYAASAITAITAQSTTGVYGIEGLSCEIIKQQIKVVTDDMDVDVIKIGMLGSNDVINAVASSIPPNVKIVLDPVMVAKDNTKLIEPKAVDCLVEQLCPQAYLITPNIEEANIILNRNITNIEEMKEACIALSEKCKTNVLLKGGHLTGEDLVDILSFDNKLYYFPSQHVDTKNTHGTGCSLSSSIAANLAKGYNLVAACDQAIEYVQNGIVQNYSIGKGKGPINHFHNNLNKECNEQTN